MHKVSVAFKEITGCVKTYVLQFAEHPKHPHVHFHIVPRMANQPQERRSTQIMEYLCVSEDKRVSEEAMNKIGEQVRQTLQYM